MAAAAAAAPATQHLPLTSRLALALFLSHLFHRLQIIASRQLISQEFGVYFPVLGIAGTTGMQAIFSVVAAVP